MDKIKEFLKAFLTFLHMYRDGFYCSENIHTDRDGTRWGFYSFNEATEYSLFDVAFNLDKKRKGYYHVHGDDFRKEL